MKKIIYFFVVLFLMFSTSVIACGDNENAIIQGPFKINDFHKSDICFQSTIDKRGIDFFLSFDSDGIQINKKIDEYHYSDGPVKFMSIFFHPVRGKTHTFIILRWEVNYDDEPLYQYYYEIYAYEKDKDSLVKSKITEDPMFSGYQIIESGVKRRYALDNAQKVKSYIDKNYK
ncbi:hypothetical protein ABLB84_10895 [Xenorhabdus szentirmaii]|uniref:hypothetical protein n=1 Tax=Xenorhabdus szentirmaii TaxID=290112 RepID=UPI0032B865C9